MSETKSSYLVTEPVLNLMRKYSVPCVISLLVAALYNIVDQIFIANASYLGSFGNAANTVVYPLTVVTLSLAVMIGDGACSFVSISMGQKEEHKAAKTIGSAILTVILVSVIVTAIYLIFANPILAFFGGTVNEQTFLFSKEYFFYISLGIPFYMFGQAMNPIIRSDGSPKMAMAVTVSGALLNCVLDPVFIYVFKWGMMGAAIATVAGQVVTAVLSIWYLRHMKLIQLGKSSFGLFPSLQRRYLALGMTSFLSQISIVASMAAIQNMTLKYSALDPTFSQPEYTQIPMAVLGIVMKFFQIVISISVGMAAGCIPVAGYNIGAGEKGRARELFIDLLVGEAILGIVATLIVELCPQQLISIFGAANESIYYTQFAIKSFRIYLCMTVFATINKGTFIYLQALGKAMESTLISLLREIVFGVGLALLLPHFFGLDGVLYSMPVSDILAFAVCVAVIGQTLRELNTKKKPVYKNA